MKKTTITLVLLLFCGFVQAQNDEKPFVIPAIKTWKSKHQKATVDLKKLHIDARYEKELAPYVQTFKQDLIDANYVKSIAIQKGKAAPNTISFTLGVNNQTLGDEGYRLVIDKGIKIEANTAKGAFWATRTLLQLLEQNRELPFGEIIDYPDYPIRGFMLDVGRKFFSIDFLRQYVKLMAYYKMNDFQIHLNDNGFKDYFLNDWTKTYSAFRLQSDTYPELTAKDGSYSKAEFRDLQLMAQRYGVYVLPEIDVPAHSLAFSQMMPELGSKKYGMDHLDLDNPKVYEVVDNVFKEYLEGDNPVFVGKEVHIGTDEYAKDEAEKFRAFTDHYIKYVEKFGKKARLWGALTHAQGKTPVKVKDVTMNVWYNGYAQPKDMLRLGYDIISTPDGWLYIVPNTGYYHDFLELEKIYNQWAPNVVGNEKFEAKHPQIKGGSFAVWNDHVGNGISERDVHYRVFPAMQVLAQKMWDGEKTNHPYSDFAKWAKKIGEGPKSNMIGQILDKEHSERIIKTQAELKNKNDEIAMPYDGLGYDYSVSFDIKPSKNNANNAVIFSNRDTEIRLKQNQTGKLGFSRDGYDFTFDYQVPEDQWTQITITGNFNSTALYVGGKLIEKLLPQRRITLYSKLELPTVSTLFFPLSKIGKKGSSFVGELKHIKIYNYEVYK